MQKVQTQISSVSIIQFCLLPIFWVLLFNSIAYKWLYEQQQDFFECQIILDPPVSM